MNLKNNYCFKKRLKRANKKCKNFNTYNVAFFKKIKKNTWRYHYRQNFLSFWAIFCPSTLLITWKIKNLKKWKKHLEISCYTCVPQTIIISCMVPEIWSSIDRLFFYHFGPFFPFYPHNNLENQNFEKMNNLPRDNNHYTHMYHKWRSHDVWVLRYGVVKTWFFLILD